MASNFWIVLLVLLCVNHIAADVVEKGHRHQRKGQHQIDVSADSLPCCPATCPFCLHGTGKKQNRNYIDQRGNEYAEPQVVRKKPGAMLQKSGELLKSPIKKGEGEGIEKMMYFAEQQDAGYVYEKGRVRPIVDFNDADLYLGPQWQPLPVCLEDSDCPCYNCKCCYTETIQCTVIENCEATVTETTTIVRTTSVTSTYKRIGTVTAYISFLMTDSVEFRSTETFTATLASSETFTIFNTAIASTIEVLYIRTETYTDFSVTPITSVPVPDTVVTITVNQDVISIIEAGTSIWGGYTTLPSPFTLILTESIPSYVPFTLQGKARTASSTLSLTWYETATLKKVTERLTPSIPVETTQVTQSMTSTMTRVVEECNGTVQTLRITPTKTILRSIGTITPTPVPCCAARQQCY